MAKSVLLIFLAASCTSDEFFGIEENYEGIEYRMIKKIAHSKEYIEFQKLSIQSMTELCNIDTTKLEFYDTINGKRVLVSPQKYTIRPVLDARRRLIESFPEYKNASIQEKNQIKQIAMMDNGQLREYAYIYMSSSNYKKTKSYNVETDAYRYMIQSSRHEPGTHEGEWVVTGVNHTTNTEVVNYWYIDEDYWNCIYDAIDLVFWFRKEQGGLGWFSDGSGIRISAPEADSGHLPRVWINAQPWPSLEFHVHPSGNLTPSEADMGAYYNHNGLWHLIFDVDGNYSAFYI